MSDPFHHSKYSIEHAERRIIEFEREASAFHKTNPCERVIERDLDTLEDVHKIKLVKPMPIALPGIAFDAVNNLRSALDQAGYAVALAIGNTGKQAKFPFGLDITEVKSRANRQSRDIPKEIFDMMVLCEPYKGGNDLLWVLNELCNTNKHEIILPIAMGTGTHNIVVRAGEGPFSLTYPKWNRTKNELEFARVVQGGTFTGEFKFAFFVAFGDIDVVAGQSATGVLNNLFGTVKRILMAIEAEASRIGLFK